MQEHIVATFDSNGHAQAAANALEEAGIPASAIRRYRADDISDQRSAAEPHTGGFWSWLLGEEGPDVTEVGRRDGEYFDGRRSTGHVVLAVTLEDDSKLARAMQIIDAHDPIDVEEETAEEAVLQEPVTAAALGKQDATVSDRHVETIPLAEEELQIGKRVVDRGTTRVRRYVVETPVEKEVTLRGERIIIERRVPQANISGAGAFEERTIEVRETEEVPVVAKTTHVAEEVIIRREATERVETVRDTVRREEVEITDDKGKTLPR